MIEFNVTPEIVGYIVGNVFIAGAIYGGIRKDLKAMSEKIAHVEQSSDQAHRRIDDILGQRRGRA